MGTVFARPISLYYHRNRNLAKPGTQLFYGSSNLCGISEVGLELGLHILEHYKFVKGSYTNFRILMRKFVNLPPYSQLSQLKAKISPELVKYFDEAGEKVTGWGSCHQKDCLVKHLLRLVQSSELLWLKENANFCAKVVLGMDNRGDEKEYNQRS